MECINYHNSSSITLIKGDTLSLSLSINGVDTTMIDKVYFTCSQQNINELFTLNGGNFVLSLSPETTSNLKEITCDYDITVVFLGGETMTSIYRSAFTVLPKTNPINTEGVTL